MMKTVPEELRTFFKAHSRCALAFSGGADSAYLLYAACCCGCEIVPLYVRTAFQPEFEYRDAKQICDVLGVELHVIREDILNVEKVCENPSDRCYYCKTRLFTRLIEEKNKLEIPVLIDGTNASDDADDRPGMRALRELGVLSPLRECGITKAQVRAYSKRAGLFTWDKPAYACLATRIPTGMRITEELLKKVEHCEDALFAMHYSDFRVRVYHGAALLQLPAEQMSRAIAEREKIRAALGTEFERVFMELKER